MPIVEVRATKEWYPCFTEGQPSAEQLLVDRLCPKLPRIVAEALTDFGFRTMTQQVGVVPSLIPAGTLNIAALWVVVRPMLRPGMLTHQRGIWQAIADGINSQLELRPMVVERPKYDLDLLFDQGAGGSFDENGKNTASW